MTHVSKPLVALLLATVVFFALWMVALKPSGSSGGSGAGTSQGLGQYQADINAAHKAVQTSNAASARAGGEASAPPATTAHAGTRATAPTAHASRPAVHAASSIKAARITARPVRHVTPAVTRLTAVGAALHAHRVLALLFYNPAAADDRAVRQELGTIATHGGRVLKLAIPLSEIGSYTAVTDQVPVNVSPTLVLVAGDGQADELVGYTDPFEVSQRVDDALAVR